MFNSWRRQIIDDKKYTERQVLLLLQSLLPCSENPYNCDDGTGRISRSLVLAFLERFILLSKSFVTHWKLAHLKPLKRKTVDTYSIPTLLNEFKPLGAYTWSDRPYYETEMWRSSHFCCTGRTSSCQKNRINSGYSIELFPFRVILLVQRYIKYAVPYSGVTHRYLTDPQQINLYCYFI